MKNRRVLITLGLALALCAEASASSSARASAKLAAVSASAAVDGVAQRVRRKRVRRQARRAKSADRAGRGAADGVRVASTPAPTVTEIDAEGLKKLLSRGDDPAKARPLLVNFWATWCDPCREEFPDLVKIDAEFRPRGLDFILVSADDVSEIKSGVPAFLRQMRATTPSYLLNTADVGAAMALADPRWGGELPATFLFDREGRLVFKHTGRIKPDELRAELEKVLAGK